MNELNSNLGLCHGHSVLLGMTAFQHKDETSHLGASLSPEGLLQASVSLVSQGFQRLE